MTVLGLCSYIHSHPNSKTRQNQKNPANIKQMIQPLGWANYLCLSSHCAFVGVKRLCWYWECWRTGVGLESRGSLALADVLMSHGWPPVLWAHRLKSSRRKEIREVVLDRGPCGVLYPDLDTSQFFNHSTSFFFPPSKWSPSIGQKGDREVQKCWVYFFPESCLSHI